MPLDLVILAAGLGSRFGGDKQVAEFGPSGETLLELNTYDGIKAGADSVTWVTRTELVPGLLKRAAHVQRSVPARVRVQPGELDPADVASPRRERPWGTAHAWMSGQQEDVAALVLNADDLYGAGAIRGVVEAITAPAVGPAPTTPLAWIAGYPVASTLSPHGGVSRALIATGSPASRLAQVTSVTELQDVRRRGDGVIRGVDTQGVEHTLSDDQMVSMNLWGFSTGWSPLLRRSLQAFREIHGGDVSAEFRIPDVVFEGVSAGAAHAFVVPVTARWAGVTFPEDRPHLEATLLEEFASGAYPSPLFPLESDSAQ